MKRFITTVICLVFSFYISICVFANERLPPLPECSEKCFLIASRALNFQNVSRSYADYIFSEVQTILYEYLARGKMDSYWFLNGERVPNPRGTLLNLECTVYRKGDFVYLWVVIEDYTKHEEYLNTNASGCFYNPNVLLQDFSASFAEGFSLKVVNEYHYVFRGMDYFAKKDSIVLGDLRYVGLGGYADIVYDLRMTEDSPNEIIEEINSYSLMRNVKLITSITTMGIGGIALLIYVFGLPYMSDKESLAWGIASAVGYGVSFSILIPMINESPPARIESALREWSSSRCK